MKKRILALAAAAIMVLTTAGCAQTDLVAKYSADTFETLLQQKDLIIAPDEASAAWSLAAPTGERFLWTWNSQDSGQDLVLEFDLEPFLNAGLDPQRLSESYRMPEGEGLLRITADIGDVPYDAAAAEDPSAAFREFVKQYRPKVGYHEELDHYGVELGNGNMFEWAKDLAANDKDLVFVLNPQPFIDAGVDPSAVEGWVFAKVKVKNADGKVEEKDKLLKPFSLN